MELDMEEQILFLIKCIEIISSPTILLLQHHYSDERRGIHKHKGFPTSNPQLLQPPYP